MATSEFASQQEQINISAPALVQRLEVAKRTEMLSSRDGKEVIRCVEENGETFIVRNYNLRDFSETSPNSPPFHIALQRFGELLEQTGIEVAHNTIVSIDERSAVLLVEDVTDAIPVSEASTETKVTLATQLGRLLDPTLEYQLGLQMIMEDMIVIDQSQGTDKPKFIDIDPYVIPNIHSDQIDASVLQRITTLLWDKWCNVDERQEVMAAFEKSVAECVFSDDNELGMDMLLAFSHINIMKSGIDPRT